MAEPFPARWKKILEKNVPLYRRLPSLLKPELHGHIQVLLAEKNFEGCGGLKMTDEIRVTVAAHACLLLLNRKTNYYSNLDSIVVYPSTFVTREITHLGNQAYVEGRGADTGESWQQGVVVLAWDDVKDGAMGVADGQNVVLHEFAHQLDQENGIADGAPVLDRGSAYVNWARVFTREYKKLQRAVKRGARTVVDEYGASNPAEFFAVATETFFEKPWDMKRKHPELYEALKIYYKLDPAEWVDDPEKEE